MPDSMLPERHFPLQNLELERTDFYTFEGDKSKPLLLFGLRGPGGMNCLWPVIQLLSEEGYPTNLLIDSAAKRILETKDNKFTKQPSESPLKRIMETKPAVAITEFSADVGTALNVTWSEESFGVPTVWIEDSPDALGINTNVNDSSMRINPDYYCVMNDVTKDIAIRRRPNMDPDRIVVTGHPDFDKYATVDSKDIRQRTRKTLEISENDFLIVYSGLLPPQTPEILNKLVEKLNKLKTSKMLVLLLSKHPRDTYPQEEYDKILAKFTGKALNQEGVSSEDIGFACDLLVAPGRSTEALKSAFRRVPSMFVLTPADAKELTNDELPITYRVGATDGVFDYTDLAFSLDKLINKEDYRNQQIARMKKHFNSDAHSTQRVAEVIKSAAQNYIKNFSR